ncbi:hypothetical protein DVH24_037079 [Malus domestica]|uniref:GOLD domain-containing protein n=1 Tax=Malus domestica TaxID=3750 RepID=A0A498HIG6_MALDO|nr:hypothetical protein DVH24_037079 [Malus domestica]
MSAPDWFRDTNQKSVLQFTLRNPDVNKQNGSPPPFGEKLKNSSIGATTHGRGFSFSLKMSRINFSIILILGLMSTVVHSMRFDLQSGATKCISDDIKSSSMTVGKYAVVNPKDGFPIPDSHKLTIRVTSPYGSNYHYGDHVESGNFAFTAAETGDYSACFWVSDHKPSTTVTIDFDWKTGVAAKDWSKVAKKGQIETMELELKKLYDTVSSIHDEMFYLREREEGMQQLNRSTNSKMAVFSGLSLFVCLSVAVTNEPMQLPGQQQWQARLSFSLAYVAQSCLSMTHLKQIHGRAVVTNLQHHVTVLAKMFRFAAISPSGTPTACSIKCPNQTLSSPNTLIRGYSKSSSPSQSVVLFNQMRVNCVDQMSLPSRFC